MCYWREMVSHTRWSETLLCSTHTELYTGFLVSFLKEVFAPSAQHLTANPCTVAHARTLTHEHARPRPQRKE